MCDFCDKIYDEKEIKDTWCLDRKFVNVLVEEKEKGKFYLWHECEDSWYSGLILEMNYCHKCGKKLC